MVGAETEAAMTGILDRFHVEHGQLGARVLARSLQLTANCTSDAEIDGAIEIAGAVRGEGALLLVVRGDVAISWKHFARSPVRVLVPEEALAWLARR